jgi:hypothetical protein
VVRIRAAGTELVVFKKASSGYLSCSDPRLHIGLGDLPGVDEIEVDWPSGRRQLFKDVNANQILAVDEPEA